MDVFYNNEQLLKLISDIYELTDIWVNIHDLSGKDIQIRDKSTDFCRLINNTPQGHARCVSCDENAAKICKSIKGIYHYRCHAGICETLIPILDRGEVIAYLGFGQLLDESPIEEQWTSTARSLNWYNGNLSQLHEKFLIIRQYPRSKSTALAEILKTIASYVQSIGIVASTKYTDLQRLDVYLAHHYAEKLSLKQIASDLHCGTTKLCALAKTLSNGHSLTWLIALYRIRAAQQLLIASDKPISEIALMVGYEDYNYFTKVFKSFVGITPSMYRKTML